MIKVWNIDWELNTLEVIIKHNKVNKNFKVVVEGQEQKIELLKRLAYHYGDRNGQINYAIGKAKVQLNNYKMKLWQYNHKEVK